MASTTEGYYQKVLRTHEHILEGLYFVDVKDTISYSELYTVKDVLGSYPTNSKNIDSIVLELSESQSRYFELIANISSEVLKTSVKQYFLVLESNSKDTGNVFLSNRMKRNNTIKGGKRKRSTRRKIFQKGGRVNYDGIIIYKYIDPVIRMCCEYVILLDNHFKDNPAHLDTMFSPDGTVLSANLDTFLDTYWKHGGGESTICKFGFGLTNCCTEILRYDYMPTLSLQLNHYNLDKYKEIASSQKYIIRPMKTMFDPLFNLEPASLLLKTENPYKIKLTKIMQATIDKIIERSGNREGSGEPAPGPNVTYPPIHLLEVLDIRNKTWTVRSEIYHLSKSPCVHNGIQFMARVYYFLKYFGLHRDGTPVEFASISWLHTIGHALDRLYCGHSFIVDHDTRLDILRQIKNSFQTFLSQTGDSDVILNFFKNPFFKEAQVDLFYFMCVNDLESLKNVLITKITAVTVNYVKTLIRETMYAWLNIKDKNAEEVVDWLMHFISSRFNDRNYATAGFPCFDIGYSFTLEGNELKVNYDCEVKLKYGCKLPTVEDQAFLKKAKN